MDDTIVAISTALGVGAISIIRVSGDDALDIVSKIFRGADFYGEITLQKIHRSKIAELAQKL